VTTVLSFVFWPAAYYSQTYIIGNVLGLLGACWYAQIKYSEAQLAKQKRAVEMEEQSLLEEGLSPIPEEQDVAREQDVTSEQSVESPLRESPLRSPTKELCGKT